jgi:hypothetical protein
VDDILAALAEEAPAPSADGKCKVKRWLDALDPDRPGREALIEAVETTYDPEDPGTKTLLQTARVLKRLGLSTTYLAVGDHRAGRCRCGD